VADAGFTCRALWALRDDRTLDAATWKVAVALLSCSNELGQCRSGLRRIAATARTSPGAVRKALMKLERHGGPLRLSVQRGRRTESGDADTNFYQLTLTLPGCDQENPTCDQPDPTGDQGIPTVGSGETHGCDQPDPTGGVSQITEEDLGRGSMKTKVKRVRAARWRRCPDGWEPSDEHRQIARERGVSIDAEVAKFRDHDFNAPKSDADATFRNWLRNARPAPHQVPDRAAGLQQRQLARIAQLEAEGAAGTPRKALP
jgi:hypothetical protein